MAHINKYWNLKRNLYRKLIFFIFQCFLLQVLINCLLNLLFQADELFRFFYFLSNIIHIFYFSYFIHLFFHKFLICIFFYLFCILHFHLLYLNFFVCFHSYLLKFIFGFQIYFIFMIFQTHFDSRNFLYLKLNLSIFLLNFTSLILINLYYLISKCF